jgi:hypothetical protein
MEILLVLLAFACGVIVGRKMMERQIIKWIAISPIRTLEDIKKWCEKKISASDKWI